MTVQLALPFEAVKGLDYLGFSPNDDPETARRTFEARFGQPPKQIVHAPNNLLVGPIPGMHILGNAAEAGTP
jgi:hypothetical protein